MQQVPTPVTAVREIMSRRIVAIRSDCELGVAVDTILRTSLRHLVVVDPDRAFVGIITADQVLAGLGSPRRQVGDHVADRGLRVHESDPVRRAAEVMVNGLVDALPVVDDDGQVVGVVTWSDIIAMVARQDLLSGDPA